MLLSVSPQRSVFAAAVLTLALVGCSGSNLPELGSVTGVVTYEGQPVPSAIVTFQPQEGRPSVAMTDDEGKYELLFVKDTPGALLGDHKVTISNESAMEGDQSPNDAMPLLPAKYNSQSTLTALVEPGSQTIDFPLQ
ncbi:transthyretin-like family protein [Rosistilla ulvae]|nr:carboxypeptidase regulatory-like domain-containing protein [Rosistilla ulvae]